jgi:hypothetical protein
MILGLSNRIIHHAISTTSNVMVSAANHLAGQRRIAMAAT